MPRVALQYFDGCPHWRRLDERLAELADTYDLTIEHVRIATPADAERLGFRGSPTLLVDGADPFAGDDEPIGLSCRIFQTPDGPAGTPSVTQLREVLS